MVEHSWNFYVFTVITNSHSLSLWKQSNEVICCNFRRQRRELSREWYHNTLTVLSTCLVTNQLVRMNAYWHYFRLLLWLFLLEYTTQLALSELCWFPSEIGISLCLFQTSFTFHTKMDMYSYVHISKEGALSCFSFIKFLSSCIFLVFH